ncbi:hypothetical protein B0H13DRAFT_1852205 [Mycena leptocephala]|nr:hypothetical protein B0H13DRAFT_1852205 [Mycena leptocephala]
MAYDSEAESAEGSAKRIKFQNSLNEDEQRLLGSCPGRTMPEESPKEAWGSNEIIREVGGNRDFEVHRVNRISRGNSQNTGGDRLTSWNASRQDPVQRHRGVGTKGINGSDGINYKQSDFKTIQSRVLAGLSVAQQTEFEDAPVICATKMVRDLLNRELTRNYANKARKQVHDYHSKDRFNTCPRDEPLQRCIWQVMVMENVALKASTVNGAHQENLPSPIASNYG